jgi:hypothetical protein
LLVNAHDRGVDHLHVAVVSLDNGVHQSIPDAGLSPSIEAVIDRGARPVAFREIRPGRELDRRLRQRNHEWRRCFALLAELGQEGPDDSLDDIELSDDDGLDDKENETEE